MFFTGNDNEQVEVIMTSSEKSYRKKRKEKKKLYFQNLQCSCPNTGNGPCFILHWALGRSYSWPPWNWVVISGDPWGRGEVPTKVCHWQSPVWNKSTNKLWPFQPQRLKRRLSDVRALAILEDPGLFPSTHRVAHMWLESSPRGFDALFGLCGHCRHMVPKHTHR